MNLKNIGKKSIFFRLIKSYLLIIAIITIIIASVIYTYAYNTFNNEVENLNEEILNKYADIINNNIINVTELKVNGLLLNDELYPQILKFRINHLSLSGKFEFYNKLKQYLELNYETVNGIHIFNKNTNELISTTYGYMIEDTFTELMKNNVFWIYGKKENEEIWIPPQNIVFTNTGLSKNKNVITYLRYVSSAFKSDDEDVIIAVDINEKYILDLLNSNLANLSDSNNFFITNKDGEQILASNINSNLQHPDSNLKYDFDKLGGSDNIIINGKKSIMSYTTLNNGWKLVRTTLIKEFYSTTDTLLLVIIIASIIIFLVGGIAAYYTSKSFYTPVAILAGTIMKMLDNTKSKSRSYEDEFKFMNQALNELDETIAILNDNKNKETPYIKNNIVKNAMLNLYSEEQTFKNQLESITDYNLDDNKYITILVHISKNTLKYLNKNQLINKEINLIKFIEDQSSNDKLILATKIMDSKIAILFITSNINIDINFYCENIIKYANEELRIDLDVSFGNHYNNILEINKSYKESINVYKHKFYFNEIKIFNYITFDFTEQYDSNYFLKLQEDMRKSIKKSNEVACQKNLDLTIDKILKSNYKYHIKELCLYNFAMILIAKITELKKSKDDKIDYYIEEYHTIENIYMFKEWCTNLISLIMNIKEKGYINKNKAIINIITEYIEENLKNDLSLTVLSEKIKLSKGYISTLFNEFTGMHVADYITQIRMEHARSLLQTTNLKIEKIAKESGYLTPHYFTKKFKEYYGKTPKVYRSFVEKKSDL